MSEKPIITPERHQTQPENIVEARQQLEHVLAGTPDTRHELQPRLEHIQKTAEHHARPGKEIKLDSHETERAPAGHMPLNRELKKQAYNRSLTAIRGQLSPADKAVSKVIHQPLVSKLSDLGEHTIARPAGLLGGGLTALIGSSMLLYFAKHYGFEYNFLAFFLLFIAGFVIVTLTELALSAYRRAGR